MIYNLIAKDHAGAAVFGCRAKNKDDARRAVLNSPYLMRVATVEYKK